MPELPEVEVVRQGLERHVRRRRVTAVEVLDARPLRRQEGGVGAFSAQLVGRRLAATVRRGKLLWVLLDDGRALAAHLGMSGQLLVRGTGTSTSSHRGGSVARRAPAACPVADPSLRHRDLTVLRAPTLVRQVSGHPRHLRVRLHLSPHPEEHDGGALGGEPFRGRSRDPEEPVCLDLVDQRMLGGLHLVDLVPTSDGGPGGVGSTLPLLPADATHVARDLLDPGLDRHRVVERVRGSRRAVKSLLLDQQTVSGIGNIYADEGLWQARVHGARPGCSLAARTVARILESTEKVVRQALAVGGTSFDTLYVDVEGAPGFFARELSAYGRAGQPCRRCQTAMRAQKVAGRSHTFCPRCQRRGAACR